MYEVEEIKHKHKLKPINILLKTSVLCFDCQEWLSNLIGKVQKLAIKIHNIQELKLSEHGSTWLYENETRREFPSHLNPLTVLLWTEKLTETALATTSTTSIVPFWVPRATSGTAGAGLFPPPSDKNYCLMLWKCKTKWLEIISEQKARGIMAMDIRATVASNEGDGTARVVTVEDKRWSCPVKLICRA